MRELNDNVDVEIGGGLELEGRGGFEADMEEVEEDVLSDETFASDAARSPSKIRFFKAARASVT